MTFATEPFNGTIARTLSESRPWWPGPDYPPAPAPNIIIVLCDDLGFADLGCYGAEIDTPYVDALAARGSRYVNFHANPMCSPTRASLLTGVNSHAAGVGWVGLNDFGFPGYRGRLAENVATAAECFRAHGYATLMVGKWHLSPPDDLHPAAGKASWPLRRGFDRFYGFMEPNGFTNLHHPHWLIEDNHVVEVDEYPAGYYFTDDITDKAIAMIRSIKAADPRRPFFLHLAHGAVHGPLHAKASDLAKYRGRYDAGWDVFRERRFARQLELGLLPPGTRLPLRNDERGYTVPAWNELPERERLLFARHMEAYAAMVDSIDQNLGRMLETVDDLGELDNTIVIFTSDNGASADGYTRGSLDYVMMGSLRRTPLEEIGPLDYARQDLIGGPQVLNHYPQGWAMVSNTPFRLYKMTAFAGGHQVPFIISWPAEGTARGAIRRQYTHVTDVLPTLLELTGLAALSTRHGAPVMPMAGASLAATMDDADAAATHGDQYYEVSGHRAYYEREGWEAVTHHRLGKPFDDGEWRLYHVETDPTQIDDLAAAEPDRTRRLDAAWEDAARANSVFPLDDALPHSGRGLRDLSSPLRDLLVRPIRLTRDMHTLEPHLARGLVQGRSFGVDIRLDHRDGDEGVLVAHGGVGGGYCIYVEAGRLALYHHVLGRETRISAGTLAAGLTGIQLDVVAAEGGLCDFVLSVEGAERARASRLPAFAQFCPFEGIDVGVDRRSPVDWSRYEKRGSFPYSGILHRVTYSPGEFAADSRDRMARELRQTLLVFDQ